MGFFVIGFLAFVLAIGFLGTFDNDKTKTKLGVTGFVFLVIGMLMFFIPIFFVSETEYQEPELICEMHLDKENVTHYQYEPEATKLNDLVHFCENEVSYESDVKITNFKFVDCELEEELVIQIYRITPKNSCWRLSPGEIIYECVIKW